MPNLWVPQVPGSIAKVPRNIWDILNMGLEGENLDFPTGGKDIQGCCTLGMCPHKH